MLNDVEKENFTLTIKRCKPEWHRDPFGMTGSVALEFTDRVQAYYAYTKADLVGNELDDDDYYIKYVKAKLLNSNIEKD